MHEHIFNANSAMRLAFDNWINREAGIELAVKQVKAAASFGIKTIVDATPINLGRDIHVLREVSEKSEVNIIASTGLYYNHEPWMGGWNVDQLVEFLMDDIEKGVQGTPAKAGIIKCATDKDGVTESNEKLLRMAARLNVNTGIPITTHTDPKSQSGLGQLDVFADEGVDLSQVIIGHSGDSQDYAYLESILERGSMLGMDRFGIQSLLSTEDRIAVIKELCARGWSSRMVLSHDASSVFDWYPAELFEKVSTELLPDWNFSYIPRKVLTLMIEAGISESDVTAMIEGNPEQYFGFEGESA
jgi:phosphotriesterase-related protein